MAGLLTSREATPFEINALRTQFEGKLDPLENPGFSDSLRREHDQLFLELIRQEMVVSPERGRLLAHVRDQLQGNVGHMQKLYESCLGHAATKHLLAKKQTIRERKEIPELRRKVLELEDDLRTLAKGWEDRRAGVEQQDAVREIEHNFLENQLSLANRKMTDQIEDRVDSEHKWLDSN